MIVYKPPTQGRRRTLTIGVRVLARGVLEVLLHRLLVVAINKSSFSERVRESEWRRSERWKRRRLGRA